jgi:hypothetical protein
MRENRSMLTSIEGVYRKGRVELREQPNDLPDEARVIVTFLDDGGIDLRARGIDEKGAAEVRERLATFAEEWESPEMAAYDDYDASRQRC